MKIDNLGQGIRFTLDPKETELLLNIGEIDLINRGSHTFVRLSGDAIAQTRQLKGVYQDTLNENLELKDAFDKLRFRDEQFQEEVADLEEQLSNYKANYEAFERKYDDLDRRWKKSEKANKKLKKDLKRCESDLGDLQTAGDD